MAFEAFRVRPVIEGLGRRIEALHMWDGHLLAALSDGGLLLLKQEAGNGSGWQVREWETPPCALGVGEEAAPSKNQKKLQPTLPAAGGSKITAWQGERVKAPAMRWPAVGGDWALGNNRAGQLRSVPLSQPACPSLPSVAGPSLATSPHTLSYRWSRLTAVPTRSQCVRYSRSHRRHPCARCCCP